MNHSTKPLDQEYGHSNVLLRAMSRGRLGICPETYASGCGYGEAIAEGVGVFRRISACSHVSFGKTSDVDHGDDRGTIRICKCQ